MKATELRIGNLFMGGGMVRTVNEIHNESLEIKPIPLTEEWLLKFGFESLLSGAGYVKNHTEIGHNHNGFYIIASGLKIEYVHQIQNLYFALTGKEL